MSRTVYYHICDDCGAHLDPGETCDCKSRAVTNLKVGETLVLGVDISGSPDTLVITIGRQTLWFNGNPHVEIINTITITGPNAEMLYSALLGETKLNL